MKSDSAARYLRTVCLLTLSMVPMLLNAQEGAESAVGARLEAEPLAGQKTFYIGERIPLELGFSSGTRDRFEINMAGYDRSGRMSYERFEVSPKAGWSDPLARYFSNSFSLGGLTGFKFLSATPTTLTIDLNEWVRFDQPGTYRVAVISRRVSDQTKKSNLISDAPYEIRSKPFVLKILAASPEWQEAKLQTALAVLAAGPNQQGQQATVRKAAMADVRFLGTKGAIEALAANLRDDRLDVMTQSGFGLMGVAEPMRDVAIQAMEQKLDDPVFPISGWFITSMAALKERSDRSQANEEVCREVLAALPRKEGKARAATIQSLFSNPPASLDPASSAELSRILSASFLDLSEDQQAFDLNGRWDLLRSASMLPVLQALARLPLVRPGSNETTLYSRRELKSAALRRWYELDPAGAAQEIVSQIGSATPSLTAQSVTFLPEQALPHFEPLWAQRLSESSDYEEETVLAGLLVRFGTGAATAQIVSKLRTASGACAPQAANLAYLVKFNSDQVRPLLQHVIDAGGSGKTGCYLTLFQDVSLHASGTALTEVAVASLDNADRRVAADALMYLADHGRREDRKAILDRYREWSEQWSGKADVLDLQDRASTMKNYPEISLGTNLARALIANQGWVADKDLIARVMKMCIGQQMCQSVQQLASLASPPYRVTVYQNASSENYQVGQYSAKSMQLLDEKIAQFPKGTFFQLASPLPHTSDQKALESAIEDLFKRNGMSLEAVPK